MKIVSFNANSIRTRLHQIEAIIKVHNPEVIAIQETKVFDPDFPVEAVEKLGYHASYYGQKTHYGVATLTKTKPLAVRKGFAGEAESAQRRMLMTDLTWNGQILTVINGYFPQGENRDHPTKFPNKREFYQKLQDYLETSHSPDQPVVVLGDFNISPEDIDIGIGAPNARRWLKDGKCSFLPEEREWYQRLLEWGLKDSFRKLSPDVDDQFSWFDYRSRGFERDPRRGLRIDHILATAPLIEQCKGAGIDWQIRGMDRPSDHAPVWAQF